MILPDFLTDEPDDFYSVHDGEYEARFCCDCDTELLPSDKARCRTCEAEWIEALREDAGEARRER